MESASTHGRVARASRTFAGQPAQVIDGTLRTTWFGPSVASAVSDPPAPHRTPTASTTAPTRAPDSVRMLVPPEMESRQGAVAPCHLSTNRPPRGLHPNRLP